MVKRVSKRVSEIVFLIAAGGSTYYLIEIWFRGFSHWTMFVLGGVALTFCSFQGEVMHWSEPMWIQIIRAVLFLTSLEFMTGIICNKWLKIALLSGIKTGIFSISPLVMNFTIEPEAADLNDFI